MACDGKDAPRHIAFLLFCGTVCASAHRPCPVSPCSLAAPSGPITPNLELLATGRDL
jgi:hypothetical protein